MRLHFAPLLCLALVIAACGADNDRTADTAAEIDGGVGAERDLDEPVVADEAVSTSDDTPSNEEQDDDVEVPSASDDEATSDSAGPALPEGDGFSLNGFRYCEILITVAGDDGAPVTEVWGTPGVGPCENEAWNALDPDAVLADFGASSIHMNGPRYFTVDGFVETVDAADATEADAEGEVRDVGGISMRLLATVGGTASEPAAYDPGLVTRTVTMAFNAGTEIYELADLDGNTYVMQSYALIQDPDLTAADLASLGDRLDLPEGWSYTAQTLEQDLQLRLAADGAIVVQDELENTYQRNVVGRDVEDVAGSNDASGLDDSASCGAEPTVLTTTGGVDFVRTPDSCFDDLPDWSFAPEYVEIDGLRQAYVDEGPADGDVVLLLHGQPSWSYLYRYMIPVFVDAGYRVIAMDHLGMGRSDKPTDIAAFSYLGHGERLETFIDELELTEINLFVQDWGSLIGLKVAGERSGLFASVTVGNGSLPVVPDGVAPFPPVENPDELNDLDSPFASFPEQQAPFYDGCEVIATPSSEFFADWMLYAMTGESFTAGAVIEALTWFDLPPEEEAAYDAPFPDRLYMAGPRVFPSLVNELGGATAEAWAGLQAYTKPFLTLWADNDPGSLGACETQERLIDGVPGASGQPHDRLAEASHFLQDDQGTEIAARIVDWMSSLDPTG